MWKDLRRLLKIMLLSSVFNKSVISVEWIYCFKMMKRDSVDLWRPLFNNMWKTWLKMPPNLQLSWLLWYFNLVVSLHCRWPRAFSPADEHVSVWLGEKVFDMVESLLIWDCPLPIVIVSFDCPLFLSFSPILLHIHLFFFLFFFPPNFLRVR